tara:strand:- start:62 stop:292 length:231 start_codon:yes stop_codon:yes gene_type:complete
MNLYADGSAEHFVLTDPTFQSLEQCQAEAWINRQRVEALGQQHLGGPAKIYCFSEESLIAYFQQNAVGKPTKKLEL